MSKSPFDEAKTRTAKGAARQREQKMMQNMDALMREDCEEAFKAILTTQFGLIPGSRKYEAALAAWREGRS